MLRKSPFIICLFQKIKVQTFECISEASITRELKRAAEKFQFSSSTFQDETEHN